MYLPQNHLPHIKDLKIDDVEVDKHVASKREEFTTLALLVFCPYKKLSDLKLDESYW